MSCRLCTHHLFDLPNSVAISPDDWPSSRNLLNRLGIRIGSPVHLRPTIVVTFTSSIRQPCLDGFQTTSTSSFRVRASTISLSSSGRRSFAPLMPLSTNSPTTSQPRLAAYSRSSWVCRALGDANGVSARDEDPNWLSHHVPQRTVAGTPAVQNSLLPVPGSDSMVLRNWILLIVGFLE